MECIKSAMCRLHFLLCEKWGITEFDVGDVENLYKMCIISAVWEEIYTLLFVLAKRPYIYALISMVKAH